MTRPETLLTWLLRLGGVLLLLALPAAVMPFAWMDSIHRRLGMGALPDQAIVGYLTRSCSALYAMHGGLTLFLSWNVRRHLPVIECLALLGILFGIGMLVIDFQVGMPRFWTWNEGPFIIAEGVVVWWLAQRVKAAASAPRS